MKRVLRWLLRRVALFAALFLAIGFATFAGTWLLDAVESGQTAMQEVQQLRRDHAELTNGLKTLEKERARLVARYSPNATNLAARTDALAAQSEAELNRQVEQASNDLAGYQRERDQLRGTDPLILVIRGGSQKLVRHKTREMKLDVKIVETQNQLSLLRSAQSLLSYRSAERMHDATEKAAQRCSAASGALGRYRKPHFWTDNDSSSPFSRWLEDPAYGKLVDDRNRACSDAETARREEQRLTGGGIAAKLVTATRVSKDQLAENLGQSLAPTRQRAEQTKENLVRQGGTFFGKLQLWLEDHPLGGVFWKTVAAFLGVIAMPYLIRLLFWFVLAPIAERRPHIRISVPGGEGRQIPLPDRSTTSAAVRLEVGEELLVREDYLQSTSHRGSKNTLLLLDWRHPLTSLVSGMKMLTRIRGAGEVTTVSAVRDPFAEVTVLTLPAGTACVLQPRALAAAVQPIGRRLRITTHWRPFSLNAWLTLQLRYIVFHGPCRLVLKGGRGVRVERAEQGRIFGADQLVGFSADLAYSVARTETFIPYLLGREPLFKDKVEAGAGILVVEEAPMAGSRAGEIKHGLEGAFDVMTKALGM
ncbi:hypothetical protein WBP06_18350 (plasmid) [Novosphingobium sp. BL-8H]|uniref:hypothetical protein n=1 Tax=Novosphingobium sp. BL-8H TaxID=3127640 RepID=UPI003756E800